jgi:hypothetical protein
MLQGRSSNMSETVAPQHTAPTETLQELDLGERLFIWGFRSMAEYRRRGRPTIREMQEVYSHFRVDAAFPLFDELIQAFAWAAHTPIEVHMPGCPCVSAGEAHLLRAAAAAQGKNLDAASQGFTRWIPACATGCVLEPVCAIGRTFEAAGLILPVRHANVAERGWQSTGSRAIH